MIASAIAISHSFSECLYVSHPLSLSLNVSYTPPSQIQQSYTTVAGQLYSQNNCYMNRSTQVKTKTNKAQVSECISLSLLPSNTSCPLSILCFSALMNVVHIPCGMLYIDHLKKHVTCWFSSPGLRHVVTLSWVQLFNLTQTG